MREIPLLKPDGTIDECLVGIVQATMQFPDDVASIDDEIGAYRYRSATGFRDTELGRYQQKRWLASRMAGICAGTIFYTMCMFAKHQPEMLVGMNKAAMMTVLELEKHGHKYQKNESTIKKYWSEYKNSAHLWAALLFLFGEQERKLPIEFIKLLNVAEGLIKCGIVVEDWDPWRPPSSIVTDTTLDIREPDAEDIALVQKYRANGQHLTS